MFILTFYKLLFEFDEDAILEDLLEAENQNLNVIVQHQKCKEINFATSVHTSSNKRSCGVHDGRKYLWMVWIWQYREIWGYFHNFFWESMKAHL